MKANSLKVFIILTLVFVNAVNAQTWKELNPPPNIFGSGAILSVASDSSGNIYAAGNFKNSNNEFIVVKWDGSNWSEVKNGNSALKANNVITCIKIDKKGNLYAAGGFTDNTGNYYVAQWNGNSWSEVGTGANALNPDYLIYSMTLDNANNLYVAGGFTNSADEQYVAKWDGSRWTELGAGANGLHANGLIYALATDNAGNVYTAGHFTNSVGKYYVAKYNGTNWTELGSASPLNANDPIRCMVIDQNNNIYCAGDFKNSSVEYYVAKWNGINWTELGAGVINGLKGNGPINALAVNTTGVLYAGGYGTDPNGLTELAKWDGNGWTEIFNVGYATNNAIQCIGLDRNGNVYAGGNFGNGGGHTYVAIWDGITMKELGRQGEFLWTNNGLIAIVPDVFGNVYALGDLWIGSFNCEVAKWNGITWTPIRSRDASLNMTFAEAMTVDSAGTIYIGGRFTNANGEYYVAKWDGNNWTELTNATKPLHAIDPITSLCTDKHGNVYARGLFIRDSIGYDLAKWNGTGWEDLLSAPANEPAPIIVDAEGTVYMAWSDNNNYGRVSKVVDSNSVELGAGGQELVTPSFIYCLATDLAGNLYACGRYDYVSRWNGTTWSTVGGTLDVQTINSLVTDPAGNLYAAANRVNLPYIAKWNGTSWSELGGPILSSDDANFSPLARDILGNIYSGGHSDNVMVYGNSALILQQPALASSPNQYCKTATTATFKILNLPATPFITVSAKLDNVPLTINTDGSLTFNPSTLSLGPHQIKFYYSTRTDTMFTIKDFNVVDHVTPEVDISANTTTVLNPDPIVITAINTSGGGVSPLFTFAGDRNMNNILQAESANNTFMLDPGILVGGENRIYVRMRTSDACYTVQTNIDSIAITKSLATGIVDVDYPNHEIYVYPNPFSGTFTINGFQVSKSYSISMANTLGQIIHQEMVRNSSSITITKNIPEGSYWIIVYDDSKKKSLGVLPLIKQ